MINLETLNHLLTYINHIDENYEKLTIKKPLSKEEHILACLSCLIEETWETSAEIRKKLKLSFNQKKVDNFKNTDLEDELVDIFITFLLLCKSLDIKNLDEAIFRKIWKNNDRGY